MQDDPAFAEFKRVFGHFLPPEQLVGSKEAAEREQEVSSSQQQVAGMTGLAARKRSNRSGLRRPRWVSRSLLMTKMAMERCLSQSPLWRADAGSVGTEQNVQEEEEAAFSPVDCTA